VADDERSLLRDIQKLIRLNLPAFDRRNDRALGALAAVERVAMPDSPARHPAHHARDPHQGPPRGRRRGKPNQGQAQNARPQSRGPRPIASTQPAARWSPVD
jgi:hypothetical protein